MKGLILCGGQSTRMGTDKGLIVHDTQTWAQTAMDKLSSLSIPVSVSVNSRQYDEYSNIFPENDLVQDNKALDIHGPLLGVLSAHLDQPHQDLFVLACDMPLMDVSILRSLMDQYTGNKRAEAFVFTAKAEPEPLCAIYTAAALQKIYNTLQNGALHRHSMKFALSLLNVHGTPITQSQEPYFRNFNAHAALNGL